jgi:hypothetical protein
MKTKKVVSKKVKKRSINAGKVEYDGIQFDSKLEIYCYKKLVENLIEFKYVPTTFQVLNPFVFNSTSLEPDKKRGELLSKRSSKLQGIKYTPDFVGDKWIIETKGRMNESFPLRWKLFKKYLTDNNIKFDLFLPKNQKQVDQCITIIKSNNNE